jgi:O-succinylbenzoate synthase
MITLYRYTLPFTRPVATHTERIGLLIRDGDKWGEAAPWPGLSRESLDEAEAELQAWRSNPAFAPQLSSVAFAVESVGRVSDPALTSKIPINALLSDEPLDSALCAVREGGFRTLKIKVGRQTISAEAERVVEIHRQLGGAIKLRLDANRAWSLADALDFAGRIAGVPLAYIEEPLQKPTDLSEFHERTGLPLALDETLLDQPLEHFRACRGIRAVVIKPMVIGGLRAAERLAATAKNLGWLPVFSAVYESGVGIRTLARLAARCGAPGVAMGFDTYRCLADDVLLPRLAIRDGMLDLVEAERAQVCVGKLQVLA